MMSIYEFRALAPELSGMYQSSYPVGSRRTVVPAPTDTDDDWLLFTKDVHALAGVAIAHGFEVDSGSIILDPLDVIASRHQFFWSMSREADKLNIIITQDETFLHKFLAATSVAKRLNLQGKDDRIALFQAVLYGNGC